MKTVFVEIWTTVGRGALSMARCEHPTHHINWGTYSWRTETGKIVWEIVFNADHALDVFCLNVLNRLGENRFQCFLIISCVCWDGPVFTTRLLKFRPYHKFLCSNEILPMTSHFLMHSTSRFHLLFSFVHSIFAKVDRKKSLANYMRKQIGFVLRFWILYKKRVVNNGPSQRHRPVYVPPFLQL